MIEPAMQNWKQIPVVLSVMALSVLVWVSLNADELGLGLVCGGESVSVPRGMNHALVSKIGLKRSAMIVQLPKEGDVYWHQWLTSKEALVDSISQSAAGKPEPDQIVYLKASFEVSNRTIVDLLKLVRRAGLNRIGLVVHQQSMATDRRIQTAWLEVRLENERNRAQDISELKPDPLRLVAGIGSGGKLTLNTTDVGTIEDPGLLTSRLTEIFAERAQAGTGQRTVVLRAADEIEYGEVAKLVDCLTGAGADPIVMQLETQPPIRSRRHLASR